MDLVSGLAFIEVKNSSNAIFLLKEWLEEGKQFGITTILMNLATSTKSGEISNRTLVLRDFLEEDGGLVFVTNKNSRKIRNIMENPKVACTLLLIYSKNNKQISRQIRVEGEAKELSKDQCKTYYDKEPLYCKIRSYFQQGEKSTWEDLKDKHDQLLKDALDNNKSLEMPGNQVAYKIVPNYLEFYYAYDNYIADRIKWNRVAQDSNEWVYERIQT